jgi:hypothetical protein
MTEASGHAQPDSAATIAPDGLDGSPNEQTDQRPDERPDLEASDSTSAGPESAPEPVRPLGRRRPRRRTPGLIVAALLVGAGVFLALRGMQQVVARAPSTPAPTFVPTPAPTFVPPPAPVSSGGLAAPTPQPTPTSSPLILFP